MLFKSELIFNELMIETYHSLCMCYGTLIESQPLSLLKEPFLTTHIEKFKAELFVNHSPDAIQQINRALYALSISPQRMDIKGINLSLIQIFALTYFSIQDAAALKIDYEVALSHLVETLIVLDGYVTKARKTTHNAASNFGSYAISLWFTQLTFSHRHCDEKRLKDQYIIGLFYIVIQQELTFHLENCAKPTTQVGLHAFLKMTEQLQTQGISYIWPALLPQIRERFRKEFDIELDPEDFEQTTLDTKRIKIPDMTYLKDSLQASKAYQQFINTNLFFFKREPFDKQQVQCEDKMVVKV